MNNTKITIIIPTYNRAWCIGNAIKSVVKQNYDNWELYIVDDGSVDNTKEVVKEFLQDNRIKYFFKKNEGKAIALNHAINKGINGNLLLILDSDDEYLSGYFSEIVKNYYIDNNFVKYHYKAKIGGTNNRYSYLIGNVNEVEVSYEDIISGNIYKGDFSSVINTKYMGDMKFEEKCPNGLETIFWYRLSRKGLSKYFNKEYVLIDSTRVKDTTTDNLTSYASIYKRAPSMIEGYDILINENKKEVKKINKSILSHWYLEQFQWCIIDRQIKRGFTSWEKSFKYANHKGKIKLFIFLCLFLIPKPFLSPVIKFYYSTK